MASKRGLRLPSPSTINHQPIARPADRTCPTRDLILSPRSSTPDLKERATIVCRQGQRVLLVARTVPRWVLPVGTIKSDELSVDAACRELREETGLIALELTLFFSSGD
ncbi:NUDIX domain-containing protein [Burkholderia ambifaria]|uniref:NUDIX domain-containing protein n=1 Tax=Burkholderia ambifaria TaxID=152480 RepID=UPI00398245E1